MKRAEIGSSTCLNPRDVHEDANWYGVELYGRTDERKARAANKLKRTSRSLPLIRTISRPDHSQRRSRLRTLRASSAKPGATMQMIARIHRNLRRNLIARCRRRIRRTSTLRKCQAQLWLRVARVKPSRGCRELRISCRCCNQCLLMRMWSLLTCHGRGRATW